MFLHLKNILTQDEVQSARTLLDAQDAPWVDGRTSAGGQAVAHKRNEQLAKDSAQSHELRALVLAALQRDALFFSAALPKKIFNPLFNRYSGSSNFYGDHVDGAVLRSKSPDQWVRSDISCTLFLAEPEEYDGGELLIEEMYGPQAIKLPAGDLVLYPSKSLHRVMPVTRGARVSSFMWMQSLIRDDGDREMLFRLDVATQRVGLEKGPKDQAVIELTGVYHNLLRRWAEV